MSDNSWQETGDTSLETLSPQIERPLEADVLPTREGLPRNFRMRADRHYVDQLAASSADQPVRMLPLSQIDSSDAESENDLRPLIESIRLHGIVHPLLVRRCDAGFVVVAGRKRLSAARALRLATVPCLVRELTDTEADALAAADNVAIRASGEFEGPRGHLEAQRAIAAHLATARGCADMWATEASGLNRPAVDLLKAHAWRATALLQALDLIADAPVSTSRRERALASVVEQVVDAFGAEMRLARIDVRTEVRDDLSTSGLNEDQLRAGLSGALLAMIPFAQQSPGHAVIVKTSSPVAGSVALDVVLPGASVARWIAAHFFDADFLQDRPGGYEAAIGAQAARTLAERHNGTAKFEPFERGCRLTITVPRRS